MKKSIKYFVAMMVTLSVVACEDVLEFGRDGGIVDESEILGTQDGIISLVNGAYAITTSYMGGEFQGLGELMGDNLEAPSSNNDLDEVYRHNVLFFNATVGSYYARPYQVILNVNKVLENVDLVGFSQAEVDRIKGESFFLRSLAHYELVRLFGHAYGYSPANDHPGIAYKEFSQANLESRLAVGDVYDKVITELQSAISLLPESNGIYADRYAAMALLARVYFQQGDYSSAVALCNDIVNSGKYQLGTEVDRYQQNVVLPEVIFHLQSFLQTGGDAFFSSGGFTSVYTYRLPEFPNPLFRPTQEFYDTYATDSADLRLGLFTIVNEGEENQFIACTKFNEDYFNVPVLHLTEVKLIRAEALAELGQDLSVAIQDINDIRERAHGGAVNNLPPSASPNDIISAARYERAIELFGEGDSFHQIKRRGAIEGEPADSRGDSWDCNGMILQFPISEKSDQFELNPTGGC